MSEQQEDLEYAEALAEYRAAAERLRRAKQPVAAREKARKEALRAQVYERNRMEMERWSRERDQEIHDYRAIFQKASEGTPHAELAKLYGKKIKEIDYIVASRGHGYA